ncbi:hypothetical protein RI578_40490 (plasmid) [Streptomyces sp. BB1-1-1]|uniref:hypothetical protein n=1 Tax=Streptomyces sp. BB1-1-1 TaxID=3074430 RepID=UPI002877DE8D|nr:hypothetical protein [Streptomyces sp. BB1-1-1]WND40572.1 hypothetical protein RI578_40490 [Streptomyces sp. BB1-1-1]
MASSENTTASGPGWVDSFRHPDTEMERRLRVGGLSATTLTAAGTSWDAVVIAPLERGLAALDALDVPLDAGFGVYADYRRYELIVLVAPGAAAAEVSDVQGVRGVRVLSRGSWVLMPTNGDGTWEAATLSRPARLCPRYVDPARLCAAAVAVDAARGAPACAS